MSNINAAAAAADDDDDFDDKLKSEHECSLNEGK